MKKITYIVPTVRVKNVTPLTLMAGSPTGTNQDDLPIGDNDDEDPRAKDLGGHSVWED